MVTNITASNTSTSSLEELWTIQIRFAPVVVGIDPLKRRKNEDETYSGGWSGSDNRAVSHPIGSGVEPPRGPCDPERAVCRQHGHFCLGVEQLTRQALSGHGLLPPPRAGSRQSGPACMQRLPVRVPCRNRRQPRRQSCLSGR